MCLAISLAGGQAAAAPLAEVFATCTGRYSAEVAHAWLIQSPETSAIERKHAWFKSLLIAAADTDASNPLIHQRVDAKVAHANMLSTAQFSQDLGRARWARDRAAAEIALCDGLLLGS
ncbi:MAG: hypothetical protein ACE369_19225 [Roseovarius sp.]